MTAPTPSPPRRAYSLFILCLIGAFNYADRQVLTILVQPIKAALGVSDAAMGLLTGTSFAVWYLVAGIPLALVVDRRPRRTLLALCLSGWSLMTVLCGLAQSFPQLVAARFGVAIAEAGGLPATNSMLADMYPRAERGRALGILLATSSAGIGIGLVFGGWANAAFGWRFALVATGLPGILLALLLRFTVPEPLRGGLDETGLQTENMPLRAVALALWRIAPLRYAVATGAIANLVGYGVIGWAPTFFERVHGLSSAQVGLWMGLGTVVGTASGGILSGWLTDKLQQRDIRWYGWLPALTLTLAIPAGALAFLWPTPGGAFVSFAFLIGITPMWAAPIYAAILTRSPSNLRAVAMTTLTAGSTFVGLGLGPFLIGVMNDILAGTEGAQAIQYSLLIGVAGFFVAALLALVFAQKMRNDLSPSMGIPSPCCAGRVPWEIA